MITAFKSMTIASPPLPPSAAPLPSFSRGRKNVADRCSQAAPAAVLAAAAAAYCRQARP
eukprot:SAG22_NODE_214_length_15003_cov_18.466519_11_plen_59_part_00